jgi:hypothetical protein
LNSNAKVAWISPRKTAYAADVLAASLTNTYLLHTILTSVELPLAELSVNHLVAIDVPANSQPHFEHKLLKAVAKFEIRDLTWQ